MIDLKQFPPLHPRDIETLKTIEQICNIPKYKYCVAYIANDKEGDVYVGWTGESDEMVVYDIDQTLCILSRICHQVENEYGVYLQEQPVLSTRLQESIVRIDVDDNYGDNATTITICTPESMVDMYDNVMQFDIPVYNRTKNGFPKSQVELTNTYQTGDEQLKKDIRDLFDL